MSLSIRPFPVYDFWNGKPVPKSLDDMKISVRKVLGGGRCVYHPACDQARLFTQIADTEILTEQNLTAIEALGFDIRVVR